MAPDKIFVPTRFRLVDGLRVRESDTDEEYIRKDALLGWVKEKKKQLLENESANDEPSDVAAGINAGLDMLIGKLKSM